MRELIISGRRIADDEPPIVVGEIGGNHCGSVALCKEIISMAAAAGVWAVKLQRRELAVWAAKDPVAWAKPRDPDTSFGATEGEHRAALEFSFEQFAELKAYAEGLGLVLFSTAWDVPSVRFLTDLGVPCLKLASASIVDTPLLEACAATGLPTILSTGGADLPEVEQAVSIFAGRAPLAILHCVSIYPCEAKDLNLRAITTLRERFPNNVIGLSDHQSGIAMAPVAVAMGARVLEKHITTHRHLKGSDQSFSLEADGLRRLCRDVARAHEAMGTGVKKRLTTEVPALIKQGRYDLKEAAFAVKYGVAIA